MREIRDIIQAIEPIEVAIRHDEGVRHLLIDSRSLTHPDGVCFFAFKTTSGDGHDYIRELYARGVRTFVVQAPLSELADDLPEANLLRVADSVQALQDVARMHRADFQIPVIGITGSNGKTVVKELLYQLLRDVYRIRRSPRSYNSQIGVPLSVWNLEAGDELGVFEAGISCPDEMDALAWVIAPNIGILTSIGSAHQENFGSIEEKLSEKLRLFKHCNSVIYNADDATIAQAIRQNGLQGRAWAWSQENPDVAVFISKLVRGAEGTDIEVCFGGQTYALWIPFTDKAFIENVLHCIAVICLLQPQLLADAERFRHLEPIAMRLELKAGVRGNTLINDTYNNDYSSLAIALDFQQRQTADRRRVLILSDILGSGLPEAELYKQVADCVQLYAVDGFIGVGEGLMAHQEYFQELPATAFFYDTEQLLASHYLDAYSHTSILLKGARCFLFERISEQLALQMHETTLEVNLQAIQQNVRYYRSLLPANTQMICMIKAQAYGVGAYEVARTLQSIPVDYLAVAAEDEGRSLRKQGITLPIMVMNPDPSARDVLFDAHLEPEIYSFSLLEAVIARASSRGEKGFPIHIKIDSGMHRLGFLPDQMDQLGRILGAQQEVRVHSIFSHLAAADDDALDAFTKQQVQTFSDASEVLMSYLPYKPYRHLLNTAGIERWAKAYPFDMVRLGIGLYGCSPNHHPEVKNVLKLTTRVLQVKEIGAGEPIGYSCKGSYAKRVKIVILPIGYADGYNRWFGNGVGKVLIKGVLCETVGNICMDSLMVNVTDVPNVQEGDTAVLFGESGLSLDVLAESVRTIPYELITGLSNRIKRIYYYE